MTNKGQNTRKAILAESHKLFVKKGFKDVTMKDICEATGLSRGGLKEKMRWSQLICYGIGTGEFKPVDADRVADLIMYAYQGVRMWSRVMRMDESATDHVLDSIREMLHQE